MSEHAGRVENVDGQPGVGPSPRPRGLSTPPPDPAEVLYYEGMAAYQHRNWQEALDRFRRLKAIQPNRPGLDALLDEVRWFLQLEEAAPASPAQDLGGTGGAHSGSSERWRTRGLVLLGIIGILALLLAAFQGRVPPVFSTPTEREIKELFILGQARLEVGDYEGAQAAFKKLLDISPGDPEAQAGLDKAVHQQALAQGYYAAEAAIAEENWDVAADQLAKVVALDPNYIDAQAKLAFVEQRRRLIALYDDGSRLYDLGQWQDAISQFEKIRGLDSGYRGEAVTEFLFVCYLNAGRALIDGGDGAVPTVQDALEYFSRALAIHPKNRPAGDARRQAALYLDAARSLAGNKPIEAQARIEMLLAETPAYASGQAARQLYDLLIRQAEAAVNTGDIPASLILYRKAQDVPNSDHSQAVQGEKIARAITPTATPAPSATSRPATLSPTATPFAVVRDGVANLRAGPGTLYSPVGQVRAAAPVSITGRNAGNTWLQVCCVAGQAGWLASELLDVHGSLDRQPVLTPPPPPSSREQPLAVAATPAVASGGRVCVRGQVRDIRGGTSLFGWTIVMRPAPADQAAPDTARSRLTDDNGAYQFDDLAPGVYDFEEGVPSGWSNVSPRRTTVNVAAADACMSLDFWNERESKSGSSPPPR